MVINFKKRLKRLRRREKSILNKSNPTNDELMTLFDIREEIYFILDHLYEVNNDL